MQLNQKQLLMYSSFLLLMLNEEVCYIKYCVIGFIDKMCIIT